MQHGPGALTLLELLHDLPRNRSRFCPSCADSAFVPFSDLSKAAGRLHGLIARLPQQENRVRVGVQYRRPTHSFLSGRRV